MRDGPDPGSRRQKARLLHALSLISSGSSVTGAALDCGYDSTSAFIAAFKRQFGATPGRFHTSPATGTKLR
jgi:AraC-like DNA-binding protein